MSKIHVISPGRNPGPFLLNCIDSVERQTLQPNSHIIVDDMSDRETVNILKTCEKRNSYIEIIHNKTRNYRLKNIVDHASRQDPEDIICAVDSDDWLARKDALSIIKKTYDDDPKLEYVYSNYRLSSNDEPGISKAIPSKDWNPYKDDWITSHMSTFKVKALLSIPTCNFLDLNNNWFQMGTDHAYILPLLYLLRQRDGDYSAVKHIEDILYVYHFYGNPNMPRVGPVADERANLAVSSSTYIKQRGYIEE